MSDLPQLRFECVWFVDDTNQVVLSFCAMLHRLVSSGRNTAVLVQYLVLSMTLRMVKLSFTNGQAESVFLG